MYVLSVIIVRVCSYSCFFALYLKRSVYRELPRYLDTRTLGLLYAKVIAKGIME